MRRRVSGQDSAARSAAQASRAGVCSRAASVDRACCASRVGVVRTATGTVRLGVEDRRAVAATAGSARWHDLEAAARIRLDRRARLAGPGRTNVSRALQETSMNAPHGGALTVPRLSRRAESLGTENAFVVLAEVNALAREGRDIVSFCIGQPDFPTPRYVQDAAIVAIKSG